MKQTVAQVFIIGWNLTKCAPKIFKKPGFLRGNKVVDFLRTDIATEQIVFGPIHIFYVGNDLFLCLSVERSIRCPSTSRSFAMPP